MKNDPVVAIAGVTGAVGAEFIATMDRRGFRVGKLKALASARSAGNTIDFRGQRIVIEELTEHSFDGVDIALFSAGGGISRKFAPIAVKAGAVVVDNSSAFRMDPRRAAGDPRDQRGQDQGSQGHHRQSELRRDYRVGAAVADPQGQPHQARDPVDLSGGQRRRCGRDGRAGGIDPRQPQRRGLSAQGAAAPLRLQPVQPQHGDRPLDRLQRRRDQGHPGDPEDLRGRADCHRRDLRAGAGIARALRGDHLRMRKPDHRSTRCARSCRVRPA